ncbi:unnamed protein product, partial [Tetraodon nigroviridis]
AVALRWQRCLAGRNTPDQRSADTRFSRWRRRLSRPSTWHDPREPGWLILSPSPTPNST